jgi:phage terminase small subunit
MSKKPLTNKQQKFVQEYVKSWNATKAAILAGYSEKTAYSIGIENLKKLESEIEKAKKKLSDKIDVQIEQIVNELKLIGFSDIKNYVDVDPDTGTIRVKGFEEMPEGATRVIKKIREKRTISEDSKGDRSIVYSTFEFELWSKEKALELLGRYKSMFTEKVEHFGKIKHEVDHTDLFNAYKKIKEDESKT